MLKKSNAKLIIPIVSLLLFVPFITYLILLNDDVSAEGNSTKPVSDYDKGFYDYKSVNEQLREFSHIIGGNYLINDYKNSNDENIILLNVQLKDVRDERISGVISNQLEVSYHQEKEKIVSIHQIIIQYEDEEGKPLIEEKVTKKLVWSELKGVQYKIVKENQKQLQKYHNLSQVSSDITSPLNKVIYPIDKEYGIHIISLFSQGKEFELDSYSLNQMYFFFEGKHLVLIRESSNQFSIYDMTSNEILGTPDLTLLWKLI